MAFVEFDSVESAEAAMKKDKQIMGSRWVGARASVLLLVAFIGFFASSRACLQLGLVCA